MTKIIYRPATKADIDSFYELFRLEHIESYGNFGMSKEEVAAEWDFPHFDMDKHTLYAFNEDGMNIAYGELRVWREIPVRPTLFAYVHPDYRGQGIGTTITEWGMEAAKQFIPLCPDEARVVLGAPTNLGDACELLENFGFTNARQSYLMSMALRDDMPKAQFPEGFHLINMAEHPILEDFIRVYHETFRDHRGSMDEPLEAAVKRWENIMQAGEFPPENFVLLKDGAKDAAILIMANKSDENPEQLFVQTLGTMPDYRKRGFVTNLLYYAHEQAVKKGKQRIGLSVDGSSLTGANKLYEKVGYGVDMVYHVYELELRPGIELSNQG